MKRWIIPIVVFVVIAGAAVFATLYVSGEPATLDGARATHGNKARPPKVEIAEPLVYDSARCRKCGRIRTSGRSRTSATFDLVLWTESLTHSCRIVNTATDSVAAGIEKPRARIKPNETTQIEVRWQTKRFVNHYSRACVLGTNDPQRPVFSVAVKGMVYPGGLSVR